ncbi:MAG: hypothetical protein AB7O62_00690 [Pirellulales bacterium]
MPHSLCHTCSHCQEVVSGKGSRFWLCRQSAVDRRFAKYPPQPVLRCEGYSERPAEPPADEAAQE